MTFSSRTMKRVIEIPLPLIQRINIQFCQKLGICFEMTLHFLRTVYGPRALCKKSVRTWFDTFASGRQRITDLPRAARRKTGRSRANVDLVKRLVECDRRLGVRAICAQTGITYGSVQKILKDDLGLVRKAAKFVPKQLNNRQRAERLTMCELYKRHHELDPGFLKKVITMDESWIYVYDPETKAQSSQWLPKGSEGKRPVKFLRARATGKVLLVSFFDYKGLIHREFLRGQTEQVQLHSNPSQDEVVCGCPSTKNPPDLLVTYGQRSGTSCKADSSLH